MNPYERQHILKKLTPREWEVFKLVGTAKTSKEIACDLGVSEKTVQNTRYGICDKLNLNGYNALFRLALIIKIKSEG